MDVGIIPVKSALFAFHGHIETFYRFGDVPLDSPLTLPVGLYSETRNAGLVATDQNIEGAW